MGEGYAVIRPDLCLRVKLKALRLLCQYKAQSESGNNTTTYLITVQKTKDSCYSLSSKYQKQTTKELK